MQVSQPQFGRLVIREKSLETKAELDKEKLKWYRLARKSYRPAIDKLDKAGVDIEIRGTRGTSEGQEYGSVWSYVIDKKRNLVSATSHKADASPWDVVSNAVAKAFCSVEVENAALNGEPNYIPAAEIKDGKLVPTGEGVMHRLSHRGRLVETGRLKINA